MKSNIKTKTEALKAHFLSYQTLFDEGILLNKKDFTGQIGEWIVETIYEGKRATSGIQKGWDVQAQGKNIQVKTHSKAQGNSNRWSPIEIDTIERVDELIIIAFTHDYKINHFFKVSWDDVVKNTIKRGIKTPRFELSWSRIIQHDVPLNNLPHQEIISIFK